ncbi:MAG: HD domain-containing protein, partial [Lactobacillus iners]|nr:HD domain-containing protein [Lactobacillus iners]
MNNFKFEKTFSILTTEQLVEKVKSNMDERRFQHCIRVSEECKKLAKLNGYYDIYKAQVAGFIHDYAKQISVDRFIKIIKEHDFDPDLLNYNRAIWHG